MPKAIIIGGPNGAGKTTFARQFLTNEAACEQFVNADLIAAGFSPFAPQTAEVAAGKAMIERIDALVAQRSSFALESTLSGHWLLPRIQTWKQLGYEIDLHYLMLKSPEEALSRIAQRVLEGGHDVPEAIVRRRFERSMALLETYRSQVDRWTIIDNSLGQPKIVQHWSKHVEEN